MQDHAIEVTELVKTDVSLIPLPARGLAIVAGAVAGLATTVLMVTLGMALGVTTGAAAGTAEGAVKALGIGAIIWSVLTAIVVGVVGGGTARCLMPRGKLPRPALLGFLVWSLGLVLGVLVLWPGAALGAGGATALAAGAGAMSTRSGPSVEESRLAEPSAANPSGSTRELSVPAPTAEEARQAKNAATVATWTLFVAQICGLIATMVAVAVSKKGVPST